ncbi:D-alanyl-D-alanine carboxypeptidase [Streptomyces sp. NPDC000594]|uniref:D-alanyl-D-alanine carboxypeptidase family protein n=1 Tax=Streptomyces sp. NPDC000594 TaxID=3154261 RepID=UPI003333F558
MRRSAGRAALVVATASLLPVLAVAPAAADTHDDKPKGKSGSARKQPAPPTAMSTVGGARLGMAGTQVSLGTGAPVLPKDLTARSWIVADAESGEVLAAHNSHWRLPPASTLKMLFADTLLPKLPKATTHKVSPEELENVGPGSSVVGVKEGGTYSIHDLWLGVFLRSGNDAVHVLAGLNGGMDLTVRDMQSHAEELQALDTQVVSPDGYDAAGQVSSAYDLTLIARSGLQKKDFREYASTVRADFPGEGEIVNTNRLLTGDFGLAPYKGLAGVKNGNTTHAGATFTGVAERNGRVLLVTVMNPESEENNAVYKETERLLDWGFAATGKVTPVGELVPPKSAESGGAGPSQGASASPAAGRPAGAAAAASASAEEPSGGMGTALAIAGGVLVALAGGVFVVNRRWPTHRG